MKVIELKSKKKSGKVKVSVVLDFTKEVKRGARWLDKHIGPDWDDKIDIESLDLESTKSCILGQVFMDQVREAGGASWHNNGYSIGRDRLPKYNSEAQSTDGSAEVRHGFDIAYDGKDERLRDEYSISTARAYEFLAVDWVWEIQQRRKAREAAGAFIDWHTGGAQ